MTDHDIVEDGGFQTGVLVSYDAYNVTFFAHKTGLLFGLERARRVGSEHRPEVGGGRLEQTAPSKQIDPPLSLLGARTASGKKA